MENSGFFVDLEIFSLNNFWAKFFHLEEFKLDFGEASFSIISVSIGISQEDKRSMIKIQLVAVKIGSLDVKITGSGVE